VLDVVDAVIFAAAPAYGWLTLVRNDFFLLQLFHAH
jgi:hypothetical protein